MERSILALLILILASTISGSFSCSGGTGGTGDGGGSSSSSGGTGDGGGSSSSSGGTGDGLTIQPNGSQPPDTSVLYNDDNFLTESLNLSDGGDSNHQDSRQPVGGGDESMNSVRVEHPVDENEGLEGSIGGSSSNQQQTTNSGGNVVGLTIQPNFSQPAPDPSFLYNNNFLNLRHGGSFNYDYYYGNYQDSRQPLWGGYEYMVNFANEWLEEIAGGSSSTQPHQITHYGGMYHGNAVGLPIQPNNVGQPPHPGVHYNNNYLMLLQMDSLNLNHGGSLNNVYYYGNYHYQYWWPPMNSVLVTYENEYLEGIAGGSSSQHQITHYGGMYSGNAVGLPIQPNVGQPQDPRVLYNNYYLMPLPQIWFLNWGYFNSGYYYNYPHVGLGGYEPIEAVEYPVLVNDDNGGFDGIADDGIADDGIADDGSSSNSSNPSHEDEDEDEADTISIPSDFLEDMQSSDSS